MASATCAHCHGSINQVPLGHHGAGAWVDRGGRVPATAKTASGAMPPACPAASQIVFHLDGLQPQRAWRASSAKFPEPTPALKRGDAGPWPGLSA